MFDSILTVFVVIYVMVQWTYCSKHTTSMNDLTTLEYWWIGVSRQILFNEYYDIRWYEISLTILSYGPVLSKSNECTKIVIFCFGEQLYKQSMYICLPDRPFYVSHFSRQYMIVFIPNSWNFRKHSLCGKNKQDFLFLDTSSWPNCAPVVAKRPLPGILIIMLYTLVKWVFQNHLICGHVHQILAIWWLDYGTNWWFLTIIWATDHGIHFIYSVYTGQVSFHIFG